MCFPFSKAVALLVCFCFGQTLVNELKDIEKLYLYLHLPDGPAANANMVDKK